MIGYDTMIARLPVDVRGVLRGRHDDPQVRRTAMLLIENNGDCCPQQEMDAAIAQWISLGAPEPTPGIAHCPHCGDRLVEHVEEEDVSPDDAPVGRCESCDLTFGASWNTEPDKVLQLRGAGTIPGM